MSGKARHVRGKTARPRHRRPVRRAATLLTAALASAFVLAGALLALSRSGPGAGQAQAEAGIRQQAAKVVDGARYSQLAWSAGESLPATASAAPGTSATLTLTREERRACPSAAAACVDLKAHLTWLQSGGTVFYGPIRMEPGPAGSAHATPPGTFHVEWKAGPDFVSNEYNEPMPWATFFAPGGIAFHGGSLTEPSHGCVHLTVANALYYQDHLPIGAEVVVF
jgi:lipoprotein-anchoring transpeptidase ErfK/SrfK